MVTVSNHGRTERAVIRDDVISQKAAGDAVVLSGRSLRVRAPALLAPSAPRWPRPHNGTEGARVAAEEIFPA